MPDRGPAPIGRGVERFLSSLGAPPARVTADIGTRWSDIVGDRLAEVTTPGSLRDGVLVVTTTEPAVADHLKWSARTVVDRANAILGPDTVRTLRTRVVGRAD